MKITFKDVGQGDSILIEWTTPDKEYKLGIIDCNLKGKKNPILDFLKEKQIKVIDFIIMSHPHADHYSGFVELFEFIKSSNIKVKRLGHTIGFLGAQAYWKYFEVNSVHTQKLYRIINLWAELKKSSLIETINLLHDNVVLPIDSEVSITCLSPAHEEMEEYLKKGKPSSSDSYKIASRAANLLSTLLKIKYKDFSFLLSSDTEISAFDGAINRDAVHFTNTKFHVCQMPHHGSFANHSEFFWQKIDKFKVQYAVASAGKGHGHPSIKVLKFFYSGGYHVSCTNIVNGMVELVKTIEKRTKHLDSFSTLAEEYISSKDRAFVVSGDTVEKV